MLPRLLVASIFFCLAPAVPAQDIAFSVGLAVPNGPFADEGVGLFGAGGAATGYALGLDVTVPIYGPLSALGSVFFNTNRLSNLPSVSVGPDADLRFETGSYSNIPVTAGLGLRIPLSPAFEAEGFVQSGVNIARRPEVEIVQPADLGSVTDPAQSKTTLAFVLGARLTYSNRLFVGSRYLRLGEASFTTPNLTPRPSGFGEQPISLIQLLVGVRLP